MKRFPTFAFCALLVSIIGGTSASAATKYKIFLLGGQSNAAGYNPGGAAELPDSLKAAQPNVKVYGLCGLDAQSPTLGNGCAGTKYSATKGWTVLKPIWWTTGSEVGAYISFGHNMAKLFPNDSIAIIVGCAITPITGDWKPPSVSGGPGGMFTRFVKGIRQAIADLTVYGAGNTGEVVGMLWVHGELDDQNGNTSYGTQLASFIKDIRDSMKVPNMPFVLSKVSTADWGAMMGPIQAKMPTMVSNCGFFDTQGLTTANGGHWTAASQVAIGNGFTSEMMRLLNATSARENPVMRGRPIAEISSRGISVDEPSTVTISDMSGRTLRVASANRGTRIDSFASGRGVRVVSVRNSRGIETGAILADRQPEVN